MRFRAYSLNSTFQKHPYTKAMIYEYDGFILTAFKHLLQE